MKRGCDPYRQELTLFLFCRLWRQRVDRFGPCLLWLQCNGCYCVGRCGHHVPRCRLLGPTGLHGRSVTQLCWNRAGCQWHDRWYARIHFALYSGHTNPGKCELLGIFFSLPFSKEGSILFQILQQTIEAWKNVFLLTSAMLTGSGLLYVLFSESTLQPWNSGRSSLPESGLKELETFEEKLPLKGELGVNSETETATKAKSDN